MKKLIDRGKRSEALSEVNSVETTSQNLQSFLEIGLVKKEVLPSHKLQDHAYEQQNPFRLKETFKEKFLESIESSKFVSHKVRISREFDSRFTFSKI